MKERPLNASIGHRPLEQKKTPDYSEDPPPPTEHAELQEISDFKQEDVLYTLAARRNLPDVFIMKDYTMVLHADPAVNGAHTNLVVPPSELFGFNIGDCVASKRTLLDAETRKSILVFEVEKDTDLIIILAKDGTGKVVEKQAIVITDVIAQVLVEDRTPDINLESYTMTPKKRMIEGAEKDVLLRYVLTPGESAMTYQPDNLSETTLAEGSIKHTIFGAVLKGHFDRLPVKRGRVLWEIEKELTPPPTLRAVKPKFWITANLVLKPGVHYILD